MQSADNLQYRSQSRNDVSLTFTRDFRTLVRVRIVVTSLEDEDIGLVRARQPYEKRSL